MIENDVKIKEYLTLRDEVVDALKVVHLHDLSGDHAAGHRHRAGK